ALKHTVLLKGEVSDGANPIEALTRFMKNIKELPLFQDVALINSENRNGAQVFEIQANLAE
ncbi:MAG: hypothetical protein WCI27_09105, partial [Candidatus Omnitrophota bacterium]